jgi:uncharacterized membrane protein YdbT with pleckstrin-like domain
MGFVFGGVFFLIVAAIVACSRGLTYTSSVFAITNKRVLIKVGFVRRRSLEILLSKVESIGVVQSIRGRIFNYGSITVVGTGGTGEPFAGIANPLEFRRAKCSRRAH